MNKVKQSINSVSMLYILSTPIPLHLKINSVEVTACFRCHPFSPHRHMFHLTQPTLFMHSCHQLTTAHPPAYFSILLNVIKVPQEQDGNSHRCSIKPSQSPLSRLVHPVPHRHVFSLTVNYISSPSKSLHGKQQRPVSISDLYPSSAAGMVELSARSLGE